MEPTPWGTLTVDAAGTAWGALLAGGGTARALAGVESVGSGVRDSHDLHLRALQAALARLEAPTTLDLRCPSATLRNAVTRWYHGEGDAFHRRATWEALEPFLRRVRFSAIGVIAPDAPPRRLLRALARVRAHARADVWVVAVATADAKAPARWSVLTPTGVRRGARGVKRQPTTIDHMDAVLHDALTAAATLEGAAHATLRVVSNWDVLIRRRMAEPGTSPAPFAAFADVGLAVVDTPTAHALTRWTEEEAAALPRAVAVPFGDRIVLPQ